MYTFSAVSQFERLFFEFSFNNGKRVIGTKIYGNLFEILFIDCNHMICIDSSRVLKMKEGFKVPSAFKMENSSKDVEEYGKTELVEMLVDMGRSGLYGTIEEFIKDFDDLLEKV